MEVLALVVGIVWLFIAYLVANEFDSIAAAKGYPEKKFFWWCFWLGLPGWLMVVALPDRRETNKAPVPEPVQEQLPEL